ncbi:ribonuclease H-like domain-containing protein, partial [Cubamyces lactineus]
MQLRPDSGGAWYSKQGILHLLCRERRRTYCEHQIGVITMDNGSNCGTMMDDLERILKEKGIPFHRMGNRIRFDIYTAIRRDPAYAQALSENPVKAARTLIAKARQSALRREEFESIVSDCIKNKTFGEDAEPSGTQLLRDVDTRWSSTFLMLDRLLSLYPAVQLLMQKHDPDALLSDKTLQVLSDIREFLAIPHAVQELLSAEDTPTVSLALPAYANLIEILKGAQQKLPRISHGIQAAISALEEYMAYTRQTRVYALAMMLNPTIKFTWLSDNWKSHEVEAARDWVREAV